MYKILHIPTGCFVKEKIIFTLTGKAHTKYYFNPDNFGDKDDALFFFKWSTSFLLWRKVPKMFRTEYELIDITPHRNYT